MAAMIDNGDVAVEKEVALADGAAAGVTTEDSDVRPELMGRRSSPRVRVCDPAMYASQESPLNPRTQDAARRWLPLSLRCLSENEIDQDFHEIHTDMPPAAEEDAEYSRRQQNQGAGYNKSGDSGYGDDGWGRGGGSGARRGAGGGAGYRGGRGADNEDTGHSSSSYPAALPTATSAAAAGSATGPSGPLRTEEEKTEVRRAIFKAELSREELEAQALSLRQQLTKSQQEGCWEQLQGNASLRSLQLLCRQETAKVVQRRRKAVAGCQLVLLLQAQGQKVAQVTAANKKLEKELAAKVGSSEAAAAVVAESKAVHASKKRERQQQSKAAKKLKKAKLLSEREKDEEEKEPSSKESENAESSGSAESPSSATAAVKDPPLDKSKEEKANDDEEKGSGGVEKAEGREAEASMSEMKDVEDGGEREENDDDDDDDEEEGEAPACLSVVRAWRALNEPYGGLNSADGGGGDDDAEDSKKEGATTGATTTQPKDLGQGSNTRASQRTNAKAASTVGGLAAARLQRQKPGGSKSSSFKAGSSLSKAQGAAQGPLVLFTACAPGPAYDRPLLLSPCSTLPDRVVGVSLDQPRRQPAANPAATNPAAGGTTTKAAAAKKKCTAGMATWHEMLGQPVSKKRKSSPGSSEEAKEASEQDDGNECGGWEGGGRLDALVAWEEQRLVRYRLEADVLQLKCTLRSFKEVSKDGQRMMKDAEASLEKTQEAHAGMALEFKALARKCAKLKQSRRANSKASSSGSSGALPAKSRRGKGLHNGSSGGGARSGGTASTTEFAAASTAAGAAAPMEEAKRSVRAARNGGGGAGGAKKPKARAK
eukprot:CAMPEP_0171783972 /NCGR_PEP_ID=MMETSP0991-20121206/61801_1 /TAXON_ID=483369 /ORGANISM="non described non described, Strain CCMP2098" /LENGTH=824 /DNA_ID=CAMNT_0012392191 /DNA_START=68 /DNA_END=2542 /DNA_ORIENTATION=+